MYTGNVTRLYCALRPSYYKGSPLAHPTPTSTPTMPVSQEQAPRRYADICHKNFQRWGVWDPARGPKVSHPHNPSILARRRSQVGSYGFINMETGALDIEGNVYDAEFQKYVDECDGIKLADYSPVKSDREVKTPMTSIWSRKKDFSAPEDACVPISRSTLTSVTG